MGNGDSVKPTAEKQASEHKQEVERDELAILKGEGRTYTIAGEEVIQKPLVVENITKGFKPHRILQKAIEETSEIVVRVILSEDSHFKDKTYSESQDSRYKRGFHIIALKRKNKWIYRFKPGFTFKEGDLLIGLGPKETVEEWVRCVNPSEKEEE